MEFKKNKVYYLSHNLSFAKKIENITKVYK